MTLSSRAAAQLGAGGGPPPHIHETIAADPWSPDNPDGYLNLGTAENHVLFDLLEPRLAGPRAVTAADTHYQPMAGSESFRVELGRYLSDQRGVDVDPEQLVVFGGSTPALDAAAYALCDPGDAIVIPAPYFPGLDFAFGGRAGVRTIPAPTTATDRFRLSPQVVDKAIREADGPVRAVALLSPHNPLGHVYDRATLTAVAEVVREHDLDLISDEVYAGSVFRGDFVSAAALDVLPPERVHVIWGFSKDFGVSGLRAGVFSSGDPRVRAMAGRLALLSTASSDTQALLRDLLADGDYLARFERTRRERLAEAYAVTAGALDEHGIRYAEAAAGLFVWIDLGAPSFDAEHALWQRLFETGRVLVTPGAAFHSPDPGWFRLCFAGDLRAVRTGVDRIARVLSA